MAKVTARSSTIFIATSEATRVYRSVEEIPPALRRKLQQSTRGINSATILIADKRGREELVRALQGQPSNVQCRLAETIRSQQRETPPSRKRRRFLSLRTWLELLVPVAVGASLWFFIDSHF
ncbi:MAG: hypothetical protein JO097_09115 [Acidobacteriaceae bacterium]|nr:hypothetical protein [Acidobacteriaceae bacterium]MBV9294505.1 hypothetical protein [Acidobacteriaceae bacterium]MBV9766406.1 hypothetical protein [Acidobacteriaceae bacterium]